MPQPLPVDGLLPRVLAECKTSRNLVIEAAPGAGKTTRVPPALLDFGPVLVLEPRRIAARMAAQRVAEELGEVPGETVGYQVRFEGVSGPRTRLHFLTGGVLIRRILHDAELRGVSTVVLDEFHERRLETDLALALLRRLQRASRPDLRIVVMSATLDTRPVSRYLEAPVLRSEGKLYPIGIRYTTHSAAPLEQQIAAAASSIGEGDILVFLPGAAEIRRAARACDGLGREVLPLHGDLSTEDQDRAIRPSTRRKLILSTNVAESSITIDGVTAVIDSGLARIASDSPYSGLPVLEVQRISKASANQRAGRAGRTAPGLVIRLYTADDFARRSEHDLPEIARRELSHVLLQLRALGLPLEPDVLPWFEAPSQVAWDNALRLLTMLGAGKDARELADLPVHPRLARLIRAGGYEACVLAGILSVNERFEEVDALHAVEKPLPPAASKAVRQIARAARLRPGDKGPDPLPKAVLRAFPDRVARRRNELEVQFASGAFAALSQPIQAQFLCAIEVQDRRENTLPLVRAAVAIEPDWLLDLFPERLHHRSDVVWNREAERVEARNALLFDELVIEESRSGAVDPEQAAALLAAKAIELGVERLAGMDEVSAFLARVAFAAAHSAVSELTMADVEAAIKDLSCGSKSLAELRSTLSGDGLVAALKQRLTPAQQRELDEVAPERFPLKGRQVRIHYARGQTPHIASRLQDFFGVTESPAIARGRVPLLLHLLAPNQRPVQMTKDLAGFWTRLYPRVRKELSRKYPKHAWPEKP